MRLGKCTSSTHTIITGAPWGCVLSPLLFSLHTAHLKTLLSSSWSLQTTPLWSASFRTVMSLLTDRKLRSWLSGAVLTTWSLTHSKQWRWSWTSGETPLLSPFYHHEQYCNCSGVIQVIRQLRKFNLPQELLLQFYSSIIESFLCTSITVWFSSATKSDYRG